MSQEKGPWKGKELARGVGLYGGLVSCQKADLISLTPTIFLVVTQNLERTEGSESGSRSGRGALSMTVEKEEALFNALLCWGPGNPRGCDIRHPCFSPTNLLR